tara:strand:- start:3825 stop:4349 length:525 start_codon:yes stop_codon:yes gene_type:complete
MESNSSEKFFDILVINGHFFVMGLFLVLSLFTSNLKGIVYMFGVTILYTFLYTLSNISSFYYALYLFTLIYLSIPMFVNNNINIGVIVFFLIMYISSIIGKGKLNANVNNIIIGSVTGVIWSILYYMLLLSSVETKKYLYYHDFDSNKVACSRPSKTKFKCDVYKNGELIKNNI